MESADNSAPALCPVHRDTSAKEEPVCQDAWLITTAQIRNSVWQENVKTPVCLKPPAALHLQNAEWLTTALSASVHRDCKGTLRLNARELNAEPTLIASTPRAVLRDLVSISVFSPMPAESLLSVKVSVTRRNVPAPRDMLETPTLNAYQTRMNVSQAPAVRTPSARTLLEDMTASVSLGAREMGSQAVCAEDLWWILAEMPAVV